MVIGALLAASFGADAAPSPLPAIVRIDNSVHAFGTDVGLPQSSVTSLVQSRDGYLWLGTFGGLARFDGHQFSVYRSRAGEGPSSDRILSLVEDSRAQLWIGSEDAGVSVYRDGRFERLALCDGRCRVTSLVLQGQRVLAVSDAGLFEIDVTSLIATRLGTDAAYDFGAIDRAGDVVVASRTALWSLHAGGLQPVPKPGSLDAPVGMLTVVDGEIWVATDDLYRWVGARWQVFDADHRWSDVGTVVRDKSGTLWIGTRSGAVYAGTGRTLAPVADPIRQLLVGVVDHDGTLWLGSNTAGLLRVRAAQVGLLTAAEHGFDAPGLAMVSNADGMWFGLNCSGMRRLGRDGKVTAWSTVDRVGSSCVWALHRDPRGRIWAGTTDGKLAYVLGDEVHPYTSWSDHETVRSIHVDGSTLYVAVGRRTYRIELGTGELPATATPRPITALEGVSVTRIRPARRGGLWIAGDQGALRLVGDRVVERWGPAEGISSRFVRTVYEDSTDGLWIGTYGAGLDVVRDGHVTVYDSSNGLRDDAVSCLVADGHGRLWASGNRGLSMFDADQVARAGRAPRIDIVTYGAEDGLVPEETNGGSDPACSLDDDGRLWFSLIAGFAVVDPAAARATPRRPPTPGIMQVRVSGKPVDARAPIRLQRTEDNMEIAFSAPVLSTPEKATFRIRLTSQTEWTEVGTERSVFYSSLPSGDYAFEVSVRVAGGPWSEPARLQIENPVPWHRRPVMWVVMAMVVAAGTLALQRLLSWWIHHRADRVAAPLRSDVERLSRDIEVLGEQAHRDPLTAIANRRRFDAELAAVWPQRASAAIAVLMVDVDEFKKYNDHFGHGAGDQCLRTVATAMGTFLEPPDLLARYGGEEFVVLMPDTTIQEAAAMAERLVSVVAGLEQPHAPSARHPHVTVSVGVAISTETDSIESLVARADAALYKAKHGGRNRMRKASLPPPAG